jgi:hypothetical protein
MTRKKSDRASEPVMVVAERIPEMLTEAGPSGALLGELVDSRWKPATIRKWLFRLVVKGAAWKVRFGYPGEPHKYYVRYYGRAEWAAAVAAEVKEQRRAARSKWSRDKWAQVKAEKGKVPRVRKKAEPKPKAARQAPARSVPTYIAPDPIIAAPVTGYAAGFVYKPATPFVDRRFEVVGPVPSMVDGRECRAWAAMLGRAA